MRTRLLATAALVVALAGCGGSDPEPEPKAAAPTPASIQVTGQFTLELPNFIWDEGVCSGREAYENVAGGTQVVVTDNASATVAIGSLGSGKPTVDPADADRATACTFQFAVGGVPAGKGFYGIEIGGHGRVQFTEAQLAEPVALELS